jgi:hypothetical protein
MDNISLALLYVLTLQTLLLVTSPHNLQFLCHLTLQFFLRDVTQYKYRYSDTYEHLPL